MHETPHSVVWAARVSPSSDLPRFTINGAYRTENMDDFHRL